MRIPTVSPAGPTSSLGRAWTAFGRTGAGHWYVRNVSRRVDPWLHRTTRGRVTSVATFPVVMLTAKGARSGQPRATPLVYFTDGDRVVLMASNYGGRKHPAWYHNVKANPEVTLSAGGRTGRYLAREATGEERERLWQVAKDYVGNYGQYEEMTDRTIPVVVLTPLDGEEPPPKRDRRFERREARPSVRST